MRAGNPPPTLAAAVLALSALALCRCGTDRFFGPFDLEVPSALMEPSEARTFLRPLTTRDLGEQDALEQCRAQDPPPEVGCACQFPVLEVGEQQTRVDYLLTLQEGETALVRVWIGRENLANEPSANEIPGLPRIAVLAEHHYQLLSPGIERGDFGVDQVRNAELRWSDAVHPECAGPGLAKPAPTELIIGASLEGVTSARVTLEFTCKVSVSR